MKRSLGNLGEQRSSRPDATDPIVVARRWDALGARLLAILNAWSVARALDLEFRFVWPRSCFRELHEPREIFDEAFLERFEVAASTCDDRRLVPIPTDLSVPEARALCRGTTAPSMLDVWECYGVLGFADEPAATAQARFRAGLDEIGWSATARSLIESLSSAGHCTGHSAIHVRAGDIVEGDWRQFVPVDKYVPTAGVTFAVETLGGPAAAPVVVTSDNDRYVRYLKARFDFVRSPGEVVPGYDSLSESQRALADILVLSRARRIVGPRTSAFSQLAARLGGLTVESVGELMTEDEARSHLREGIRRASGEADRWEVLRPLLARDICWFLDVLPEELSVAEYCELARLAVRSDPDHCGALSRLAIALAFLGEGRESAEASSGAERAAARAEVHADPLVEGLAAAISARVVLALGDRSRRGRQLLERLGLVSVLGRFGGREATLSFIDESLQRCEALTPYQIHHRDVLDNLRFQRAALAWLTTAGQRTRYAARMALRPPRGSRLVLPSWRPSGFSSLGWRESFPQVLRTVEIATIRIAQAIGAVLSEAPASALRMGTVDSIATGPSGLRWARGWAWEPDAGRSDLAVGLVSNGGVVSGGITSLARADVAAALDDPRATRCGFAFPIPESVDGDAVLDGASLRVARPPEVHSGG